MHYCHTHSPAHTTNTQHTYAHIIFPGNCWNIFSASLRATCPGSRVPRPNPLDQWLLFCTYYNMHINIFGLRSPFIRVCVAILLILTHTHTGRHTRAPIKGHGVNFCRGFSLVFIVALANLCQKAIIINSDSFFFLFFPSLAFRQGHCRLLAARFDIKLIIIYVGTAFYYPG